MGAQRARVLRNDLANRAIRPGLLRDRLESARFLNQGLRDHGEFDDDATPPSDSDHAPLVVTFA